MSKKREIDTKKPYRIHVNTREHSSLLPTFAEVYEGDPLAESRWYPNNPDIKDRETQKMTTLETLLALMQTGDHKRLGGSIVIFGTEEFEWPQFFIRKSEKEKKTRFTDLYNRLASKGKDGEILCAMLFEASETKTLREFGEKWVRGEEIMVDETAVNFALYLSYLENSNLQDVYINKGDLFLVTGMARRTYIGNHLDTVSVYVDHKEAMRRVTLEELTTAPPPQEPITPTPLTYDMLGKLD